MLFSSKFVAVVAPLSALLSCTLVSATPVDEVARVQLDSAKWRRQTPDDPSNVAPEDESDAEIAADGTKELRNAVKARALYLAQATATWYQIDVQSTDSLASFTSFVTATATPIPTPSDPKQTQGGAAWNVDHIFELQIIGEMGKSAKPDKIPDAAWTKVTNAIFTKGPLCTSIANDVTVLDNLKGIPNAVNTFKKQVFTGNLTGVGNPSNGDDATYWSFFGPAVQKYLTDNQQALYNGVVNNLGDTLQSIGDNDANVKPYFTSYAKNHYQGAIDFLSTWSGKPFTRSATTSSTSSTATATATATAAATATAVSCYHAADPRNTCAAVANGPGWCECGDSPATYAVLPTGQPCAWTTLPPTTSFDCAATPTPTACNVPAGCTNEAAPTGCAIACT